jgi:hypothetical protein
VEEIRVPEENHRPAASHWALQFPTPIKLTATT